MKEQEDDYESDFSLSFADNAASDNASALEKALFVLKGTLKAKEDEMTRLREEKEAAVESKLELVMQVKQAKSEVVKMGRKLIEAEKEKEAAAIESKTKLLEMENGLKKELIEMAKTLFQAQKEKESVMESKIELLAELKALQKEATEREEMAKILSQMKNVKKEAIEEVELCKKEIVELTRNFMQVQKEQWLSIESIVKQAKKEQDEAVDSKVDLMVKELKKLEKKVAQDINEKEESLKRDIQETLNQGKKIEEKQTVEVGALKTRIAKMENMPDPPNISMKFDYVWNSSRTKISCNNNGDMAIDALSCPTLKSGICEWKMHVHNNGVVRLGVITSKYGPLNQWLGDSNKTWGLTSGGTACYGNTIVGSNFPRCTNGSVVRFVLDLTGNGTLHVSVGESSLFKIFSDMRSSLGEDEGFLPAVSRFRGGKIELLDFEEKK